MTNVSEIDVRSSYTIPLIIIVVLSIRIAIRWYKKRGGGQEAGRRVEVVMQSGTLAKGTALFVSSSHAGLPSGVEESLSLLGVTELPKGLTSVGYHGKVCRGKRHGAGVEVYANGQVYIGDFLADVRHGKGSMAYPGIGVYKGGWKEGKKDGKGVWTPADGDRSSIDVVFSAGKRVDGRVESAKEK